MNNNVSRFSHPFFIIFFSSSEDDFEVSLSLSLSLSLESPKSTPVQ